MTTTLAPTTRRALPAVGLAAGGALGAVALGVAVAVRPAAVVVAVVIGGVGVMVWRRPELAAILVVGVTPLVVGIDRGRVVPVLRPNEAVWLGLAVLLSLRVAVRRRVGVRELLPRLDRLEVALLLMATANSVLPIVFMLVRGRAVEADDVSYALVLWKYIGVYALVRHTVRTDRAVRVCLWTSVLTAGVVGLVGFLQARDLLGVRPLLLDWYAPFGYTGALEVPRGGATLGLPAAAADLMILNLAVAAGLWRRERSAHILLVPVALFCVLGVLGAAEFSSFLGLVIALVATSWLLNRPDLLSWAPLVLAGALLAAWPIVQHRLDGFQMASGLPVSWTTRYTNLATYFWPALVSGWNPLLGVRPSARVVAVHQGTGFVWIESGYLWLVWGGGIPLVLAYLFFVRTSLLRFTRQARHMTSYADVAALAAAVGVLVIVVLMVFDPHLTYRGSGDCLFALLALARVRPPPTVNPRGGRT